MAAMAASEDEHAPATAPTDNKAVNPFEYLASPSKGPKSAEDRMLEAEERRIKAVPRGFNRTRTFFGNAIYIALTYHTMMTWHSLTYSGKDLEEKESELNKVLAQYSLDTCLLLRGAFVKVGQAFSTAQILPKEFGEALSTLQAGVPPRPTKLIFQILHDSLGPERMQYFTAVEDECLGAASIGQAQKGHLIDGREVVVKVQYPEMRELFQSDLDAIETALKYGAPSLLPTFKAARAQVLTEFDYESEAQNLLDVGGSMRANFPDDVVVPEPVRELTNGEVLTMSFVPGVTFSAWIKQMIASHADSLGLTPDELYAKMKAGLLDEEGAAAPPAPARPAPARARTRTRGGDYSDSDTSEEEAWDGEGAEAGPTPSGEGGAEAEAEMEAAAAAEAEAEAAVPEGAGPTSLRKRVLLWGLEMSAKYLPKRLQRRAAQWLSRVMEAAGAGRGESSIATIYQTVDTLLKVHAHQCLIDGAFNVDPHPGNILLMPDGRLGLIDFGNVKRLTDEERIRCAKLVQALLKEDREWVIALMLEGGMRTKFMNPDAIYAHAMLSFDRFIQWTEAPPPPKAYHCESSRRPPFPTFISAKDKSSKPPAKFNKIQVIRWLRQADPVEIWPEAFVWLTRCTLLLRGCAAIATGGAVNPSIAQAWAATAERAVKEAEEAADIKAGLKLPPKPTLWETVEQKVPKMYLAIGAWLMFCAVLAYLSLQGVEVVKPVDGSGVLAWFGLGSSGWVGGTGDVHELVGTPLSGFLMRFCFSVALFYLGRGYLKDTRSKVVDTESLFKGLPDDAVREQYNARQR